MSKSNSVLESPNTSSTSRSRAPSTVAASTNVEAALPFTAFRVVPTATPCISDWTSVTPVWWVTSEFTRTGSTAERFRLEGTSSTGSS